MPEEVDVQAEINALHAQIASVEKHLGDRLTRIERALLGDDDVGLVGMVQRVNKIDEETRSAAEIHNAIEDRRREGDKRLHKRIDEVERTNDMRWNRAVFLAIGVSIGSAGGAAGLTYLLTGGG